MLIDALTQLYHTTTACQAQIAAITMPQLLVLGSNPTKQPNRGESIYNTNCIQNFKASFGHRLQDKNVSLFHHQIET